MARVLYSLNNGPIAVAKMTTDTIQVSTTPVQRFSLYSIPMQPNDVLNYAFSVQYQPQSGMSLETRSPWYAFRPSAVPSTSPFWSRVDGSTSTSEVDQFAFQVSASQPGDSISPPAGLITSQPTVPSSSSTPPTAPQTNQPTVSLPGSSPYSLPASTPSQCPIFTYLHRPIVASQLYSTPNLPVSSSVAQFFGVGTSGSSFTTADLTSTALYDVMFVPQLTRQDIIIDSVKVTLRQAGLPAQTLQMTSQVVNKTYTNGQVQPGNFQAAGLPSTGLPASTSPQITVPGATAPASPLPTLSTPLSSSQFAVYVPSTFRAGSLLMKPGDSLRYSFQYTTRASANAQPITCTSSDYSFQAQRISSPATTNAQPFAAGGYDLIASSQNSADTLPTLGSNLPTFGSNAGLMAAAGGAALSQALSPLLTSIMGGSATPQMAGLSIQSAEVQSSVIARDSSQSCWFRCLDSSVTNTQFSGCVQNCVRKSLPSGIDANSTSSVLQSWIGLMGDQLGTVDADFPTSGCVSCYQSCLVSQRSGTLVTLQSCSSACQLQCSAPF